MAVNSVLPPYFNFKDADGQPLENGFIYIGQPGFEARSSPKASFFDIAQTIPTGTASGAAIRTRAGFPINQTGSPAGFYVDGDYSITVADRNGVVLYTALNTTLAINIGAGAAQTLWTDGNLGSVGGGFAAESSTGFVRPSAGVMQTAITGTLATELSTTSFRTAVPLIRTISTNVTAGTNAQGQGPVSQDFNVVTTAASNPSGVTLPTAVAGRRISVVNRGANAINVYPASGATIGALAVNVAWGVPIGTAIDFIARSATQWEVVADALGLVPLGTAGQVPRVNSGATGLEYFSQPTGVFTWMTPQSTASGTQFDFASIPAGVSELVLAFSGVSLSGTDSIMIHLGDSGGFETTGYSGGSVVSEAALINTAAAITNGFQVNLGNAANAATGFMQLYRAFNDNEWLSSANMSRGAQYQWTAQTKTLSDTLTQLRITRTGSNTFDGGRVNVGYR